MPPKKADSLKWKEPRLPKEKIKELALGIFEDKIFTSQSIRNGDADLLMMIFLPLVFFSETLRKEFLAHPPAFICAPIAKALPRSINGYPVFAEMQEVHKEDAKLINAIIENLKKATDDVMRSYK
jgi:hypothetical protein